METSGLVESEDEEGVVPLRTSTERFVDLLEESLAIGDQTAVVHGSSTNTAAGWVQVREGWESAIGSVTVELSHGNNFVGVVGLLGPAEPVSLGASATGSIPVVEPTDVLLAQSLEDGVLSEGIGAKSGIIGTVAGRGAGDKGGTVGVSRLANWSVTFCP